MGQPSAHVAAVGVAIHVPEGRARLVRHERSILSLRSDTECPQDGCRLCQRERHSKPVFPIHELPRVDLFRLPGRTIGASTFVLEILLSRLEAVVVGLDPRFLERKPCPHGFWAGQIVLVAVFAVFATFAIFAARTTGTPTCHSYALPAVADGSSHGGDSNQKDGGDGPDPGDTVLGCGGSNRVECGGVVNKCRGLRGLRCVCEPRLLNSTGRHRHDCMDLSHGFDSRSSVQRGLLTGTGQDKGGGGNQQRGDASKAADACPGRVGLLDSGILVVVHVS
mmetsp:Transcript_137084/g.238371  ORF Transcript_137084/g.238371 Transcript_137084/m.238371 type:complete len:279 (-) Transcript_137084:25-861(-)